MVQALFLSEGKVTVTEKGEGEGYREMMRYLQNTPEDHTKSSNGGQGSGNNRVANPLKRRASDDRPVPDQHATGIINNPKQKRRTPIVDGQHLRSICLFVNRFIIFDL